MNPDSPKTPREELEARLTALLLGELSADAAAAVRRVLAQDAELTKLHDRLQSTIGLVREAVATQAEPAAEQPPLRLSDERREKLLAHFKTVPLLPKLADTQKAKRSWLIPASVAAALVALLGIAGLVPNFVRARHTSQANAVINNLRQLDNAKQMWALENKKPDTAEPRFDELRPYLKGEDETVFSVAGEKYVLGRVQDEVIAETRRGEKVRLPNERESGLARASGAGGASRPAASGRLPEVGLAFRTLSGADAEKSQEKLVREFASASETHLKDLAEAPTTKMPTPPTPKASQRARVAIALPSEKKPELEPPAKNVEVTTSKPDSWHFDADVVGKADSSARKDAPTAAALIDYDHDGSLDADGRTVIASPAASVKFASPPSGFAAGNAYGGYEFKPPSASPAQAQVPELQPPGRITPPSDASDKSLVLGDTPTLGKQFHRLTSGGGGLGGSTQVQPAPQPESAPTASTLAMRDGVELVPFQPQLPAPTLKGTPEDLPKGPNIEPLGTKPAGTVVLGDPKAAQETRAIDPEMMAAYSRRYGLAHSDQSVAESATTEPAKSAAPQPTPLVGRVIAPGPSSVHFKVPTGGKSPAPAEAKADDAVAGRGLTALAGARVEGESTVNAGDLVLSRGAAEGEKKKVAEAGERYLADGQQLEVAGRIAPQEQVHAMDMDALTVTTAAPKESVGVVVEGETRGRKSSIILPATESGVSLGYEPAQTEELARAKIESAPSKSARLVQDGKVLWELGKLDQAEAKLKQAKEAAPDNKAATYYMDLVKDARRNQDVRQGGAHGGTRVIQAAQTTSAALAKPAIEVDAPPVREPSTNAPIPQPEVQTSDNTFSTFSLNVSDVAFKLAAASLEKGQMPDAASVRAEEFINAFDYRDPEAPPGVPIAFAWERARYPFAHNRDLLRFSLKTAAAGRQAGRPLNLVLLLDNSGSMERADRVQIIREALRVLAGQLQPQDKLSVITFARTPRLWVDGVAGNKSGEVLDQVSGLTPQGGTNLEEAMNLAYATALRHYLAGGINRVVLLTDGAANLGNVESELLKQKVEAHRKQGIALDCFGIGWEGFNDDLLEVLSRNGDGRYGFINSPEEAATEFAGQLAGALKVAASDVKVQMEFNPKRVTAYRQIGYAKHQLTKEQFRDNTVDAAEIAAQEAGNALFTVEVNPAGEGPLCTVRCRFKIPGTMEYREHEWTVPYTGNAVSLEQASPAMRLAASASAFAEWLVVSPFAAEVTPDALLGYLGGVPGVYGADARPKKLEWMIRQAKSIGGK